MNKSDFGDVLEQKATAEHRAKFELRQLIKAGKLDAALVLAKRLLAEQEAKERAEGKSRALELIDQANPGELDLSGIIDVLGIEAAYKGVGGKYAGVFKPVSEIEPFLPKPILGAEGVGGAVLTEGNVCILSGQGGAAKTTLTTSIALSFAASTEMESGNMCPLRDGIFRGTGGRVMVASFEDAANAMSFRLHGLAEIWHRQERDSRITQALKEKIWCGALPEPLYMGEGNNLPEPTEAWDCLWEIANEFKPKLIIIDPIVGAYLGSGNDPPRVFAFIKALANEARKIDAGVLLVGHSNKAARQSAKYDPFDAGHIAGTGAWTDAARGVMILTKDQRESNEGKNNLAISKANFGPAYIEMHISPIFEDDSGIPYGMERDNGGWTGNTQAEAMTNGKASGEIDTRGVV